MTDKARRHPAGARQPGEASEIAVWDMQRDFPHYWIWQEPGDSGHPRYIARARSLTGRPHTVMTANPAELRAELTAALRRQA
jgi:hypothetical protein